MLKIRQFYGVISGCLLSVVVTAVAVVAIPDVLIPLYPKTPYRAANSKSLDSKHHSDSDNSMQFDGADFAAQLNSLPGVVMTQMSGMGSDVSVSLRGFGDDANGNTVLVVDGVSQLNADQALPDISQWMPFNLQSMVVRDQAEGVLYGDHAMGGAVVVTTKPLRQRPDIFAVSLGSYDTQQYTTQLKAINGPWTALTLVQKTRSDNYREHNQLDSDRMQSGIAYDEGDSHWQWTVSASDQELQLPGALTAQQVAQDPRQTDNDTDTMNTQVLRSALKGEFPLSAIWQYQTKLQWSEVSQDGYQGSNYTSTADIVQWRQSVASTETVWLNSQWQLGTDALASNYNYSSSEYNPDSDQDMISLFEQSTTPLSRHLSMIVGQRGSFNHFKETQSAQSWSDHDSAYATTLALRYAFNDYQDMELRRATGFRFPTSDEVAWTQNNEPLNTETGTSYELQYQQNNGPVTFSGGVYWLDVDNEIMYVPYQDSYYFGYNENLPPTSRVGAHVALQDQLSTQWQVHGRYDWVNAVMSEGSDSGNAIPFVASNQWTAGVRYLPQQYWQVDLSCHFMGSRYPMGDVDNIATEEASYAVLDVALRYQRGRLQSSFTINNITDVRYNAAAVLSSDDAGDAEEYYYPAAGINVIWSMSVAI